MADRNQPFYPGCGPSFGPNPTMSLCTNLDVDNFGSMESDEDDDITLPTNLTSAGIPGNNLTIPMTSTVYNISVSQQLFPAAKTMVLSTPMDESFFIGTNPVSSNISKPELIPPTPPNTYSLVGNSVPMGSGRAKYPVPQLHNLIFDPTTGFRKDPATGLHYDANSGYFYNSFTKTFLFYDYVENTYCPVVNLVEKTHQPIVTYNANADALQLPPSNDLGRYYNKRSPVHTSTSVSLSRMLVHRTSPPSMKTRSSSRSRSPDIQKQRDISMSRSDQSYRRRSGFLPESQHRRDGSVSRRKRSPSKTKAARRSPSRRDRSLTKSNESLFEGEISRLLRDRSPSVSKGSSSGGDTSKRDRLLTRDREKPSKVNRRQRAISSRSRSPHGRRNPHSRRSRSLERSPIRRMAQPRKSPTLKRSPNRSSSRSKLGPRSRWSPIKRSPQSRRKRSHAEKPNGHDNQKDKNKHSSSQKDSSTSKNRTQLTSNKSKQQNSKNTNHSTQKQGKPLVPSGSKHPISVNMKMPIPKKDEQQGSSKIKLSISKKDKLLNSIKSKLLSLKKGKRPIPGKSEHPNSTNIEPLSERPASPKSALPKRRNTEEYSLDSTQNSNLTHVNEIKRSVLYRLGGILSSSVDPPENKVDQSSLTIVQSPTDEPNMCLTLTREPTRYIILKPNLDTKFDGKFVRRQIITRLIKDGISLVRISFRLKPFDHFFVGFPVPVCAVLWLKMHHGKLLLKPYYEADPIPFYLYYSDDKWVCPCKATLFGSQQICPACLVPKGGIDPVFSTSKFPTKFVVLKTWRFTYSVMTYILKNYVMPLPKLPSFELFLLVDPRSNFPVEILVFKFKDDVDSDLFSRQMARIRSRFYSAIFFVSIDESVMNYYLKPLSLPSAPDEDEKGIRRFPVPNRENFVKEPKTGLFFDPISSLYYDDRSELFYDGHIDAYITWDEENKIYRFPVE